MLEEVEWGLLFGHLWDLAPEGFRAGRVELGWDLGGGVVVARMLGLGVLPHEGLLLWMELTQQDRVLPSFQERAKPHSVLIPGHRHNL